MSWNLPPGMSDYDLPGFNEFYVFQEVECPHCGFVEDTDVLGDYDPRGTVAKFSAVCGRCKKDIEWTENVYD